MLDAYLLESSTRVMTCTLTGAKEATLAEVQWYQGSTELGGAFFANTYAADASTTVVKPIITADTNFKCAVGDMSLTKKMDLYTVSCTTGTSQTWCIC